jgi:hypothetical protein
LLQRDGFHHQPRPIPGVGRKAEMPSKHTLRRHRLAVACLAALAGATAFAQAPSEREQALEARVAELERLVQQLVELLPSPGGRGAGGEGAGSAERNSSAGPSPQPLPQKERGLNILPGAIAGSEFTYGGFVKLDAMLSNTSGGEIPDSSTGRLLYLPGGIPVGGGNEGTDIDAHGQFSRFWFNVASSTEDGDKLRGYLEFDLFGGALGNEAATNTYGVTVRHAFASWNRWLAGQTWSNFQDVAALPDSVDFIGPTEGTVFVRQAQVRYTNGPVSLSLENPQTVITPFQGGAARIASDDGWLPDLTLRYTHRGEFGHVGIAGLLRQLRYQTNDDLRWMLTGGRGIGRYIGLALGSDAVLDGEGEIETNGLLAGYVAWRHVFDPKLRGNLFYSRAELDHDVALTGSALTRRVHSLHANLIWTPLPKLDLGLEAILGQRELESGADGELRRLHFHAKYSF